MGAFGCGSIVRFGRRSVRQAEWSLGVAALVEPVLARRGDVLRRFRRRVLGRCGWSRVMYGYADFIKEVSGCGVMGLLVAKGCSAGKNVVLVVGDGK